MIYFLTSNAKKAEDFRRFGFGVKEFEKEMPEIKSPNVEEVALYKAKDTELNKIVVEDTSLYVDGAHFWGTDIKHVYEEIQGNDHYHERDATWRIALCLKLEENYYLSSGELKGKIIFPYSEDGYHFEKMFAVEKNGEYIHFGAMNQEDRLELSPRLQALRKLHDAMITDDYSNLVKIPASMVKDWSGEYQIEKPKSPKIKI